MVGHAQPTLLTLLAFAGLAACGARTDLPTGETAGFDASVPSPPRDAGAGDARLDARVDAAPQPCRLDTECADGIACTKDTCDKRTRTCDHAPDDTQCPLSYGCDPSLGCQARALASAPDGLYEVKVPSGATRLIGTTSPALTDLALAPDRAVYAVSSTGFFRVDSSNAAMTLLGPVQGALNALDVSPEGTLYGAGDATVYEVDPATGAATPFAAFPPSLTSSGDLAFFQGRLLATAKGAFASDALVEFDRKTTAARILGDTGYTCIYGLAAFGPTLYGLTCNGYIVTLDTTTGKGTLVTKTNLRFYGATAR